jgi:hypothetical protein
VALAVLNPANALSKAAAAALPAMPYTCLASVEDFEALVAGKK